MPIRIGAGRANVLRLLTQGLALACVLVPWLAVAQGLTETPGFGTRFGAEDLDAIPMRRFSYQDWVKTAPGISPTSPSGSSVLVSAFGSGVDQN